MADKNVDDVIADLTKSLDNSRDSVRRNAIKNAITDLTTISEQGRNIEQFFEAIGEGARNAQKSLDEQSEKYLLERPDFAPATTFRIPKVSANLKLAMNQIDSKKVGFVVVNKKSETQRLFEQEISFDIVAAPPPPESMASLDDLPLGIPILSSETERNTLWGLANAIKARIGKISQGSRTQVQKDNLSALEVITNVEDQDAFSASFRRTLVLSAGERLVMVCFEAKERRISQHPQRGIAIVNIPHTLASDSDLDEIDGKVVPLTSSTNVKEASWTFQILASLADRQEEFLIELKRR